MVKPTPCRPSTSRPYPKRGVPGAGSRCARVRSRACQHSNECLGKPSARMRAVSGRSECSNLRIVYRRVIEILPRPPPLESGRGISEHPEGSESRGPLKSGRVFLHRGASLRERTTFETRRRRKRVSTSFRNDVDATEPAFPYRVRGPEHSVVAVTHSALKPREIGCGSSDMCASSNCRLSLTILL